MQWKSRQTILLEAIEDWQNRGVIDAAAARALAKDTGAPREGTGFMAFVVLAGIVLLLFGVMTFVGANWDQISRPGRLGLIAVTLLGSWAGALVAQAGGRVWLAEVLVLLASGVFGAAIMLVAQLYHIQGDPHDAVFLWLLGTGLAAGLTRSRPALVLALILLGLWGVTTDGLNPAEHKVNLLFLPLWGLCAAGAWLLHSRLSGHVAIIVFLVWVLFALFAFESHLALLLTFLGIWVVVFALLLSSATGGWIRGFEVPALVYMLMFQAVLSILFYIALGGTGDRVRIMSVVTETGAAAWAALAVTVLAGCGTAWTARKTAATGDLWLATGLAAAWFLGVWISGSQLAVASLMLASSVWVVRLGWRSDIRGLRILGIFGFSGAMLLIYAETLGGLLGTSLFYSGAGLIMLGGALVISRLRPGRAISGGDDP